MSEFEDAKVRKWMEQNYPMYKENLVLGRLLYAKAMNRNPIIRKVAGEKPVEVQIKEIKSMKIKDRVCVKGVVVEVKESTYEGCAVCKKSVSKNCGCGKGTKIYRVVSFLIGDDTSMIWASGFDLPQMSVGNEVQIVGTVREYRGDKEIQVFDVEVLSDFVVGGEEKKPKVEQKSGKDLSKKLDKILNFIGESGSVKVDLVKTMCEGEGVSFDELMKYAKLDDVNGLVYK